MVYAIIIGSLWNSEQSITKLNRPMAQVEEKMPFIHSQQVQSLKANFLLAGFIMHLLPMQNTAVVKGVKHQLEHPNEMMAMKQTKVIPQKIKLLESSITIKSGQTVVVGYIGRPTQVSASSHYLQNIVLLPQKLQLTASQQSGVEKVIFEFDMPDGSISRVSLKITVQDQQSQMDYRWYPESGRKAITEELEVLRLTNLVRKTGTKCGQKFYPAVSALVWNDTLAYAARNHVVDMGKRGYFDHKTPEGVEFSKRMTAAGYLWQSAGENIAAGQPTPRQVVNAWIKSKGHCTNLMSADFKELGVGMIKQSGSTYGIYWGQNFGAKQSQN